MAEVKYLIVGGLREDYFITHDHHVHLGVLGGNAVYAAGGAAVWTDEIGIVSRVGSNYPREWLQKIHDAGIAIQGVHVLEESLDTRTFYAYLSEDERVDTNPALHFLRINQPLPKFLIDYHSSTEGQEDRQSYGPLTIRPSDLPEYLNGCKAVHIAPTHFVTHSLLPTHIQERQRIKITIDPSERYMDPEFQDDLPVLLHGLTAFLPSEREARSFFTQVDIDLWEMAEEIGRMGCELVVIKCGRSGQFLLDSHTNRKWHVPAYPAQVRDVTGAGDAFCGGFLVGLEQSDDPLEAALRGAISASIMIEGYGPLYAVDSFPGLAEARLEILRARVREI